MFLSIFLVLTTYLPAAQTSTQDSLIQLLQNYDSYDTQRVDLLNKIALALRKSPQARTFLLAADSLSKVLNYTYGKAENLLIVGMHETHNYNYPLAIDCYKKALRLFEELHDTSKVASCYNSIGLSHRHQGDYITALTYYEKSMKMFEELSDTNGIIQTCVYTGTIYYLVGNYSTSLKYYLRGLAIARKIDHEWYIGWCSGYVEKVYWLIGDYDLFLHYNKLGLAAMLNAKDSLSIGSRYLGLGDYYNAIGKPSRSLDFYHRAFAIWKEIRHIPGVSDCHNKIGMVHLLQNEPLIALESFKTALDMAEDLAYPKGLLLSNINISNAYFELGKYKLAALHGKKGLAKANALGERKEVASALEVLARVYAALGDFESAYYAEANYRSLSDSIFSRENAKKIVGLEYQYKLEKERENMALKQQQKEELLMLRGKQQSRFRNVLIVGITMVVVFLFIALRNISQKRVAFRKLEKQKKETELQAVELQTFTEQLEFRVNQRTAKIQEQNQKLRSYAFSNSHLVRAPVARILGLTQLIEDDLTVSADQFKELIASLRISAVELDKVLKEVGKILEDDHSDNTL